jgi:hypothetical protein
VDLVRVHQRRDDRHVRTGGPPRRCQIQSSQGAFSVAALGFLSVDVIEGVQQGSG